MRPRAIPKTSTQCDSFQHSAGSRSDKFPVPDLPKPRGVEGENSHRNIHNATVDVVEAVTSFQCSAVVGDTVGLGCMVAGGRRFSPLQWRVA